MRLTSPRSRESGLTLVETSISIGIMAFIFAATAFLIFYTGRNSYIVREQVISQIAAASATERISNTLRGAQQFGVYGSDDVASTVTRMTFSIPSGTNWVDVTTGVVCFIPPTATGASDGTVKIFYNSSDYNPSTAKTKKADHKYDNINRFSINLRSPSWATFRIGYIYRGFILSDVDADGDGIADTSLAGEFVTDVIAKNHQTGEESATYAKTTSTLASL